MRITKRILAFVLTLTLLLASLPVGLPKAQEVAQVQPNSLTQATAMPNQNYKAPAVEENTRLPVRSAEPSRMDYAQVDAIFDRIEAAEAAPATRNGSQTDKTEAAIQIVMESEGFLEGSLEQNGNVFTWWTDTGIRCIYHPYMRKQAKDFADKGEDTVLNEPVASRSDTPTGSDVYLIGPYYGYDSDFTDQYKTEAQRIAYSIGDTDGYTLYGGSAATVDTVAKAVSNGAVVIFDSHGSTDYENPYNEDDFVSGANYSYLCLQSSSGLTTEDYNDGAAYGGDTAFINGAVIANHMTKNSPSGIVWMAICLGMATDTLQAPLREMGVEVVYGYSQSVSFIGDYVFEYTFWTEMCQGKTVAESIAVMKNKWGSWDLSTQIMSHYGYADGHSTAAQARNAYDAFPIVVSDEDPYPGRRTSYSYGVDAPQTVRSTYHLVSQSGGGSTGMSGSCGYYGDNLTWTLDESGTLTISGEGYMADYYDLESIPWYPYRDRICTIKVEEGVYNIGMTAFCACYNVTFVSLPSTLTAIGDYAFYEMTSLPAITIPQTVQHIGEAAFALCESLTSVNIPAKTTQIGADAFNSCYGLKNLTLSEGVQEIGSRAFGWCTSLTSVLIPATVTSIGDLPFICCSSLSTITVRSGNRYYANDSKGVLFNKSKTQLIQAPGKLAGTYTVPSTVAELKTGSFCACNLLTEVKIPASVEVIDYFTFESCEQLLAIRVDSGNAYFASDAAGTLYNKDKTCLLQAPGATIGLFEVPSGVQEIAYGAFYNCAKLSALYIPKTVTAIFGYAFEGCESLKNVYYEGSWSQWQSIYVDTNNWELRDAYIHYDYHVSGEEDETVSILFQPVSVTVEEGQTAFFSVTASGADVTYQWQYSKDSGASWYNCSSATQGYNAPTLIVEGTLARNGFLYRCKVTDGNGNSCYSNAASLTVQKEPFAFLQHPQNVTAQPGDTVSFSVKTNYADTYRWVFQTKEDTAWTYWSTSNDPSQISCYVYEDMDGYRFCCIATCNGKTYWSDTAVLTVASPSVQITSQPKDQEVTEGESAVFTIAAAGSNLSYQWQYSANGGTSWNNSSSATAGYNTPKLTVVGTLARNGFLYRCKVSDSSGNVLYSNAAKLTVKAIPIQITSQPSNKSVTEGSNATFSVTATGTGLTYGWQYSANGGTSWYNCSSATQGYNTSTLTVVGTLARNGFLYRCKVTDGNGNSCYSNAASLTVQKQPFAFLQHPQNVTTQPGDTVSFSVKTNYADATYRWVFQTKEDTTWTYWSTSNDPSQISCYVYESMDGYRFRCIATYNGKTYWSNTAVLTVASPSVQITSQPKDQTVTEGESAVFTIAATGTGLTYGWQYSANGGTSWNNSSSATAGYNTSKLTVVGTLARNGFLYRCKVSDSSGNVLYSNAAKLTVKASPIQITSQPSNKSVTEGSNATFSVTATGTDLTYRWQYSKDSGASWYGCSSSFPGYNTPKLTVEGTLARNGFQYRCKLTDSSGNVLYSKGATLTVNKKVIRITEQPVSAVAKLGNYAEFAVKAEGTELTYRWQYSMSGTGWNNATVYTSGYNTPTLRVLAEEKRDGFRYRCCITDAKGNKVYSQAVTLTVDCPARSVFVSQPADQYRMAGKKACFNVELQGSIASIQWQYQTAPGAAWYNSSSATQGYNTANLTVGAETKRNGFAYRCVVTDSQGYIHVSQVATLHITKAQFNSDPANATVSAGAKQVFRVTVSGSYSQVYWQYSKDGGKSWYASSSSFPGYNTTAMTVAATAGRNGFLYRCVLVDADGTKLYSAPAMLTVK